MYFVDQVFYLGYSIKRFLYTAGKTDPLDSIKDKESSPQAWG